MFFGISRRSVLAAGLAAAAFLIAACGDNSTPAPTGNPKTVDPNKKLKLAFVTNNSSTFWTIAKAGVMKAKEEVPNIETEFQIPQDATAPTQKRIVDDLLTKGVDGIAISPIDPERQTSMLNDTAKQALLITQDSDAETSDRAFYIGTNNRDAGKQAGELINKAITGPGKIMVFVGKKDAQNAQDRLNGIKDVLRKDIEIIDVKTDDVDTVRAKANVADTLVKYPDISGLVGLWSYNGPAILSAVRDAKMNGKVKIVTFDEEKDTLDGVKAGDIEGTIVQQPYEFGRQSIVLMAKVLRGDKSAIPESKKVYVPTLVIDKSKVDEFSANLNKLLGK